MRNFIEEWENKQQQGTKHLIMDRQFLEVIAAERSTREARHSKIMLWVSVWAGIVGAVAGVIALFKP